MNREVIVLSGASRGLGRFIAARLLKKNARVAICARHIDKTVQELIKENNLYEKRLLGANLDLAATFDVNEFVKHTIDRFGPITCLINNAAVPGPLGYFDQLDLDEWAGTIDVNLMGAVRLTHRVVSGMKEQRAGKIINVCGAGIGWPMNSIGKTAYRTSKYALYGFTESLAEELKKWSIRVNGVLPGSMDTALRSALIKNSHCTQNVPQPHDARAIDLICNLIEADMGITGRLISANWDSWDKSLFNKNSADDSCLYKLRRIDDHNYKNIKKKCLQEVV